MSRDGPNLNGVAQFSFWFAERLYHELAWLYDPVSWIVSLGHWSSWQKKTLEHIVGTRVLEIGFGTGELLVEMARRKINICGLERSSAMQGLAARKLAKQRLRVSRVLGVAQQMPFANHSFDTIVVTFPAGYIFNPATLAEIARLLPSPNCLTGEVGGRLVVVGLCFSTTSALIRRSIQFVFGRPVERWGERYTTLAQAAGFHVQVITPEHTQFDVPIIIAERQL